MATTRAQQETQEAAQLDSATSERVYPMSREGKRQAYILLAGVASIWIFAVWTLITILQDGVSGVEWVSMLLMLGMIVVAPVVGWTLLEEASSRIETSEQGIRYAGMGGIDLSYQWGEVSGPKPKGPSKLARFFLGDDAGHDGTTDTTRTKIVSNVEAGELRREVEQEDGRIQKRAAEDSEQPDEADAEADVDEDGGPRTILLNVPDHSARITSPVSRFLHRQAYGSTLPIYGSLERRAELLSEIERHVPLDMADAIPTEQPQVEAPPDA